MEDLGDELERLVRLKSDGHITEAEFEALKARLLSGVLPKEPDPPVVDQDPPVDQDPLDPPICTYCGWVAPFVDGPLGDKHHNLYLSNCPQCGMKHPVGPTGVVQPVEQVSVTNSLEALFPEVAAQWHATKNGDVTPDQVVAGSMKKFWWKCPVADDHVWLAQVENRTHAGRGCPFCSGLKERMKGESSPQEPLDRHICTHCGWVAPVSLGRHNLYLSNCRQCGMKHPGRFWKRLNGSLEASASERQKARKENWAKHDQRLAQMARNLEMRDWEPVPMVVCPHCQTVGKVLKRRPPKELSEGELVDKGLKDMLNPFSQRKLEKKQDRSSSTAQQMRQMGKVQAEMSQPNLRCKGCSVEWRP